MSNTVISLFSGAGGCSLGFEQSGYKILFATDFDKAASDTYSANFKGTHFIKEDINHLDFSSVLSACGISPGELDILIGGPPLPGILHSRIKILG
jgi:Site-specific DNA methylase